MHELRAKAEFENFAERFDHFHDWVIREFRVFASDNERSVQPKYDAQLALYYPYRRLPEDLILLNFEEVEVASLEGMTTLQAEISGLRFRQSGCWVSVVTKGSVCVQARRVSASQKTRGGR